MVLHFHLWKSSNNNNDNNNNGNSAKKVNEIKRD